MDGATRPTVTITHTVDGSKSRYAATVAGVEGEAELTTSRVTDTLIIADHTLVPDSMRGMGVAKMLADRLIADARAAGERIVPLCPFVRGYVSKDREAFADVIQW